MKNHKYLIVLLLLTFFSCKKKDAEPQTNVNYVEYKVNGKLYKTTTTSVERDNTNGFFVLKATAEGNTLNIPLFIKSTGKYNVSNYANYRDTLKKMYSFTGEVEMVEYKPMNPGSIMSGKFWINVLNTGTQPPATISITDGYFVNIQSKEW